MSLSLECKKAKRTGFIPAFLCGGILAAAVPIVNMAVRSEMYVGQQSSPMQILMGANWQMWRCSIFCLLLQEAVCYIIQSLPITQCRK